jgi:hypothetical protein
VNGLEWGKYFRRDLMAGKLEVKTFKAAMVADIFGYMNDELSELLVNEFRKFLQNGTKIFCFNFARVEIVNSVALSRLLDIISEGISDESLEFYFCSIPNECRFGFTGINLFAYVTELKDFSEFENRLKNR